MSDKRLMADDALAHIFAQAEEIERLRDALIRARDFIHGPGDRAGPVLRHIDAALKGSPE